MDRAPLVVPAATMLAGLVVVVATAATLPARVATHVGPCGVTAWGARLHRAFGTPS